MGDQVVSVSIDTHGPAADIAEAKVIVIVEQDIESGTSSLV